jgi:hypothetical protein
VHCFDQPHPAGWQSEAHTAVVVGSRREFLRRVPAIHRHDERTGERAVLVRQADRKFLTGANGVRIPFGDELEREAKRPVALPLLRATRQEQALGAAGEYLAGLCAGLVPARSQRRNGVRPSSFKCCWNFSGVSSTALGLLW